MNLLEKEMVKNLNLTTAPHYNSIQYSKSTITLDERHLYK
jgi:hypothetical protein